MPIILIFDTLSYISDCPLFLLQTPHLIGAFAHQLSILVGFYKGSMLLALLEETFETITVLLFLYT